MASPFANLKLPLIPSNGGSLGHLAVSPDSPTSASGELPAAFARRNSELPPGARRQQSPLKLSIPNPRASFSSGSPDGFGQQRQAAATAPVVVGGQMPPFGHTGSPHMNDFHHAAFTDFETLESPMMQLSPEHSPIMTQLMEATSPGTASSQGSSSNGSSISRLMRFSPALAHSGISPFPSEVSDTNAGMEFPQTDHFRQLPVTHSHMRE
uniref:Uncharacterized protein n=1 Tax=Anopheles farauti TaxID=69004 RepID=A0A182Q2I0_9DIPT